MHINRFDDDFIMDVMLSIDESHAPYEAPVQYMKQHKDLQYLYIIYNCIYNHLYLSCGHECST